MAVTVSFINMKGGVGKTTLCSQLAFFAASAGYRTLTVDLDPQSNLSQVLMGEHAYARHISTRPTVFQLFDGYIGPTNENPSARPVDPRELIVKVRRGGDLDLMPSQLELCFALRKDHGGKERILARALSQLANEYDLILIDCAPTDSVLTMAAYHCSRHIVVPVKPEYLATIGLPLLSQSLEAFKAESRSQVISVSGLVLIHSNYRQVSPEARASIQQVREEAARHNWPVFDTQICYSQSYVTTSRMGRTLFGTPHVRQRTTSNFAEFVNEFFTRIPIPRKGR